MTILRIDRTIPFDPTAFIGEGWSIAEEDKSSLKFTEVDLTKIQLKTTLGNYERWNFGEEKLRRLNATRSLCLDAKVLQTLWEKKFLIPKAWRQLTDNRTTYIYFDGTVVHHMNEGRCVLSLHWNEERGGWVCFRRKLSGMWRNNRLSAVLTK
jgi:hypothetical protein